MAVQNLRSHSVTGPEGSSGNGSPSSRIWSVNRTLAERKLTEKSVEKKSCDTARAHGWLPRKYKSPGNRSAPDRIFIKGRRTVFIEYKRCGNTPTPQQRLEAAALLDAGAEVYWTDTVRGTKEALGIPA